MFRAISICFTPRWPKRTVPYCGDKAPIKTPVRILESILALPANTKIELHAPIFQVYAEDPEFIFNEVRKQGCRYVDIDHERIDLRQCGSRYSLRRSPYDSCCGQFRHRDRTLKNNSKPVLSMRSELVIH